MIRAVLFDMDGLLFDTEGLGLDAEIRVGEIMGYPVTLKMACDMLGITKEAGTEYLHRFFPDLNGDEYWQRFDLVMQEYIENKGTPLKSGCAQIIASLREKGIPYAMVSSSPRSTIDYYLRHSPLAGMFDVIVSGDMGLSSKPAPDPYLKGAELLQIPIGSCCVMEDSINGLRAGRAAGAYTVMVPDLVPYGEMHAGQVDYVAKDLLDALHHITEDVCSTL